MHSLEYEQALVPKREREINRNKISENRNFTN